MPWWDKNCEMAIKGRNRAFKQLKKQHNLETLVQYKRAQAVVRKTVKTAKRACWRKYCNKIGRETALAEVWGMTRKMNGIKSKYEIPVLSSNNDKAISNVEKAELLAIIFVKIHGSDNLSSNAKQSRENTLIVPILKPGKVPFDPTSYRPIVLTSQLGKTMERMVTQSLTHHVESKSLISAHQSGFRKGRNTMDSVLCLESKIRKAQANKEMVVAVFFLCRKSI